MRVNLGSLVLIMVTMCVMPTSAQVRKLILNDLSAQPFLFIENDIDDNFFVTPINNLNPRMTGGNRWTLKKASLDTILHRQQSLGYIDNGENTPLEYDSMFDMWIENGPVSHPLKGLRCISRYRTCDLETSLISPQTTDINGFYGVKVPSNQAGLSRIWQHGMMADAFYLYLRHMSVGNSFSMVINTCQTPATYEATKGYRCKDQDKGIWEVRKVTHTKGANLKLFSTNSLAEIFISSDGIPSLGEGNANCKLVTLKPGPTSRHADGVSCKVIDYELIADGASSHSIRVFPVATNSALSSKLNAYDIQFSLDGSSWKSVKNDNHYFDLDDLKSSRAIYIFLSTDFFKKMLAQGISGIESENLLRFIVRNTIAQESGWYEFSPSAKLIVKPRNFSVNIISDEYTTIPTREGYVGYEYPSLDFGYIVTTSGKTAADVVQIKVSGPREIISGRSYCIFSSSDGVTKVPFPGMLSFLTKNGKYRTYDAGCDNTWHDITDALWMINPWAANAKEEGILNKTKIKFSIPVNDVISQRTSDNKIWFGEVSASGEIHVKAIWRNIN